MSDEATPKTCVWCYKEIDPSDAHYAINDVHDDEDSEMGIHRTCIEDMELQLGRPFVTDLE